MLLGIIIGVAIGALGFLALHWLSHPSPMERYLSSDGEPPYYD